MLFTESLVRFHQVQALLTVIAFSFYYFVYATVIFVPVPPHRKTYKRFSFKANEKGYVVSCSTKKKHKKKKKSTNFLRNPPRL